MKRTLFILAVLPLLAVGCGNKNKAPGYAGKDLTGMVEVIRNKQTKDASLSVALEGGWEIFSGPQVEEIDMENALIAEESMGIFSLDVPRDRRSYFQFVAGGDRAIIAERHLPMEGGYNFRDLGGYRTTDGRYVKWGKIIRSDDLHNLTGDDLGYLASIPVNTIVDFRAQMEIKAAPDQLPLPSTERYELSITPGSLNDENIYEAMDYETADNMMRWMNEYFVTADESIAQYREFFRLLQDETNTPLLFHCSAGKDRTGMGAALILYALGIPEETIIEDYLASNIHLRGKYDKYFAQAPDLEPMFIVKKEYLQAGIDKMKSEYGSVENFLTGTLGVDIGKFRSLYLY